MDKTHFISLMKYSGYEKSFYLKAFHGTTLAVSIAENTDLAPQALSEFAETLSELCEHGCRVLLFVQKCAATKKLLQTILPSYTDAAPISYHRQGDRRILPQLLWHEGATTVPIQIATEDSEFYLDEVVRLVVAWRIKRLILAQAHGGVNGREDNPLSYVNYKKLTHLISVLPTEKRSALQRIQLLLKNSVGAVSLCRLQDISRELFTYEGCGTFFSQEHYCRVRTLEIDDFPQVATLIRQGEAEGFLLPRSDGEISEILLSGYGAFICSNHVAGVCCLINECYKADRAGEIAALYALTRFQGEGIGVQLIRHVIQEAQEMGLQTLFSCTTKSRVVDFFKRNGFSQVKQSQIPEAKWQGYDDLRRKNLVCLRLGL